MANREYDGQIFLGDIYANQYETSSCNVYMVNVYKDDLKAVCHYIFVKIMKNSQMSQEF